MNPSHKILLGFGLLLALSAQGCMGFHDLRGQAPTDFYLADAQGKSWASQDFRQQSLLLFFFAPDCKDCLLSSAALNAVAAAHPSQLKVLALWLDASGAQGYLEAVNEAGLNVPVAVAHPKLAQAYGAKALPYFVLLKNGKIADQFNGVKNPAALEAELAPFLK